MRDLIIFGIVFGLLPFIFKRPVIGILLFTWLSLMNPHRLTYGAAYSFPFAALVAAITFASLLFSKQPKRFPMNAVTGTLMIFMTWMTVTSLTSLEPVLAWPEWGRVMKTLVMALLTMTILNTKKDIQSFAWIIALSLGFYGLKGGVFTILSGGTSHVLGPEGSYIEDNNAIALALIMTVPIIWYLRLYAPKKWMRTAFTGLTLFTAIAAVGSYSRGALLAGGAIFFSLWLRSKYKLRSGIVLLMIVPLVYLVMPAQWFGRMETIDNYQEDSSALGRINAWHFATNVASSNFLGGGYKVFTPQLFMVYAPEPQNFHAAHSIYFQVLGEHGFIGLGLFLLLMFFAWRTGTRVVKFCKGNDELKWAHDLAAMCQVSIIGYAIGGAFLTLAYYDLYYCIIILLVALEKLLLMKRPKGDMRANI
jgi:putative inorganic carbon (HCO3(-)) transporter